MKTCTKLYPLFFFLTFFSFFSLNAQTYTVADSNNLSIHVPIQAMSANPQKSQSIYPAEMLTPLIGKGITELTYYVAPGSVIYSSSSNVIRMGYTSSDDLSSGFVNDMTVTVWTGSFASCLENEVLHIVLNQVFVYNGGNLVIEFETGGGSNSTGASFYGQDQTEILSRLFLMGGGGSTITDAFLPKVSFLYQEGNCFRPSSLMASNVSDHSATLSWSPSEMSSPVSYNLAYRSVLDTDYTELIVNSNSVLIENLRPALTYIWKVRANCDSNEQSIWSAESTFITNRAIGHFPYFCDFEDPEENRSWIILGRNCSLCDNNWAIGGAVHYSGQHSMYVSANGGVSYTYNSSDLNANIWAYRDIYFDPGYHEYTVSLYIKNHEQSGSGRLSVFAGPPATPSGGSTPSNAILLNTNQMANGSWVRYDYSLDSSYSGLCRLYFLWHTAIFMSMPPAIDNIEINGISCSDAHNLSVSEITDGSVKLSWQLNGPYHPYSYTVAYKPVNENQFIEMVVADTFCFLSALNPNTEYEWKVRSNCTDEIQGEWVNGALFQTEIEYARLPYNCDFEDDMENSSWSMVNGNNVNKWSIGGGVSCEGDSSLYISNDNGLSNTYSYNPSSVWVYRDVYFEPGYSAYQLAFDVKCVGREQYDYAQVWLGARTLSDVSVPSNGSVVIAEELSQMEDWRHVSYTLDSTFVGLQRLCFLWRNNVIPAQNPPAAIDNISIVGLRCGVPSALTVSPQDTKATLSWTPPELGSYSSYTVAYKEMSELYYTEVVVTSASCELTGLTPLTRYVWKVKVNCPEEDPYAWSADNIFETYTTLGQVPYFCDFEDPQENDNWQYFYYQNTNTWNIGMAVCHSETASLYVSDDGGVHNTYTGNTWSNAYTYRDIYFSEDYSEYELSFDYKGIGECEKDRLSVLLGPPVAITEMTTEYTTYLLDRLCEDSVWHTYSYELNNTYTGVRRLYFIWSSMDTVAHNPPAAIDNVSITCRFCGVPYALSATPVTANAVSLKWNSGNNAEPLYYSLAYRLLTDTVFTEVNLSSDTTYLLEGLSPASVYVWKIRANCTPTEQGDWSEYGYLKTVESLPYFCDFENGNVNNQWGFRNGLDNENFWHIGTVVSFSGDSSLYLSADGGTTNTYNLNNVNTLHNYAYVDVFLDSAFPEYQLSFDCKGMGRLFDYLHVYIDAYPVEGNINVMTSGTEIGTPSVYLGSSDWMHYSFTIDSSHQGAQRLYFYWNTPTTGSLLCSGVAFDDISLEGVSCSVPEALGEDPMTNSAILSWSPGTWGIPVSYTVAYRAETDVNYTEVTVNDTFCILNGLSPTTTYVWKVRACCNQDDCSDWSSSHSFITYTPLPYYCDFEDDIENGMWHLPTNTFEHWYIGNAVSYTGDKSLYFSSLSTIYEIEWGDVTFAWCYRDVYFDDIYDEYDISFEYMGSHINWMEFTKVFLGPPAIPQENQIPAGAVQIGELPDVTSWIHLNFTVDSTHRGMQRLYFLWYNDMMYNNPPAAIDNLSIVGRSADCEIPVHLRYEAEGENATVFWSVHNFDPNASYTVSCRSLSDSSFYTEIVVTGETSCVITGLSPMTKYAWKVKLDCANAVYDRWSGESVFMTTQICASLPYYCGFESQMEDERWTMLFDNSFNKWFIGNAVSCNGDRSLYVSQDSGTTNTYNQNRISYSWAVRDLCFDTTCVTCTIAFDYKGAGQNQMDFVRVYIGEPEIPLNNLAIESIGLTDAIMLADNLSMNTQWTHYEYNVSYVQPGIKRLYFLWRNDNMSGSNPAAAIDNIAVTYMLYTSPYDLSVIDVATHSATLMWSDLDTTASSWIVKYKKTNENVWYMQCAQTKPFVLTNLEENTVYQVKVAVGDYNGAELSLYSEVVSFRTSEVGIESVDNDNAIILYPNPAHTTIVVDMEKVPENGSLQLLDIYGRMLKEIKIDDYQMSIDVSTYSAGVYLLRVVGTETVFVKTFVKR